LWSMFGQTEGPAARRWRSASFLLLELRAVLRDEPDDAVAERAVYEAMRVLWAPNQRRHNARMAEYDARKAALLAKAVPS
jgi:hypothetical protein